MRADRFQRRHPYTQMVEPVCFWDIDENMRVIVRSVSNVGVAESTALYVQATVAVGRHVLDQQTSSPVGPNNPRWNALDVSHFRTSFRLFRLYFMHSLTHYPSQGLLEFLIYMKDLPESAQLSLVLLCASSRKASAEKTLVGYVNVRLFDWRNMFFQGRHTMHLRPAPKGATPASVLLLAGGSNPDHSFIRLEVEIPAGKAGRELEFPNWGLIDKFMDFVDVRQVDEYVYDEPLPPIKVCVPVLQFKFTIHIQDGAYDQSIASSDVVQLFGCSAARRYCKGSWTCACKRTALNSPATTKSSCGGRAKRCRSCSRR